MRRQALTGPPSVRLLVAVAAASALAFFATPLRAQTDGLGFTIIHTSDEHSAVLPGPLVEYAAGNLALTRGGFARLATVVEDVRRRRMATGEPVLLTSAGDHTGGSPFSWLMREGESPELTLMVEMGYDVITFGNHEFDHGPDRLAQSLAAAGFPAAASGTAIVATNTRSPAGHPLDDRGVTRTHLDTLPNGLRVGFLGLMGEGAARFSPAAEPVEFTSAMAAATQATTELRAAGAQVIIALTHSGLREDRALARAVPDIDIILGGHDHRLIEQPVMEGETIIVHPGASLQQVLVLELSFDPATETLRLRGSRDDEPFVVPLDERIPEHPAVAARIAGFRRTLEARIAELTGGRFGPIDATIAQSAFTISDAAGDESPLGNFITDAMRWGAASAIGKPVDVAFQANGNLRGDIVPGRGEGTDGRIVLHDLGSAIGMGSGPGHSPGYPIVAVWLTGEEVRRVLELSVLLNDVLGGSYFLQVSGVRARYDPGHALWLRIPFDGTPIPAARAMKSVERDSPDARVSIERGDASMYHVVTDRYVAAFLPMVGRLVPSLRVVPKDSSGAPIEDMDDAIVMRDGRPLAVWQTVLEYAAAQPRDENGTVRIAERYSGAEGRLVVDRGVPLWIVPPLAITAIVAGAALAIRRFMARSSRARSGSARPA